MALIKGIAAFLRERIHNKPPEGCVYDDKVFCIRDGATIEIQSADLVPGDLVNLTTGMAPPADMRVVRCSPDLKVKNNRMTGDHNPIQMDWRPNQAESPWESNNICFLSNFITSGTGRAMVVSTGNNTFFGRYTELEVMGGDLDPFAGTNFGACCMVCHSSADMYGDHFPKYMFHAMSTYHGFVDWYFVFRDSVEH